MKNSLLERKVYYKLVYKNVSTQENKKLIYVLNIPFSVFKSVSKRILHILKYKNSIEGFSYTNNLGKKQKIFRDTLGYCGVLYRTNKYRNIHGSLDQEDFLVGIHKSKIRLWDDQSHSYSLYRVPTYMCIAEHVYFSHGEQILRKIKPLIDEQFL